MDARKPMEWEFKALDQQSGLSFRSNFSFALVGYLLKGLREPTQTVRVVEVLHLLLRITAKPHGQCVLWVVPLSFEVINFCLFQQPLLLDYRKYSILARVAPIQRESSKTLPASLSATIVESVYDRRRRRR